MSCIVGVDVGGTFTDVVWCDNERGELRVAKVPTTANPAAGVIAALDAIGSLEPVDAIVHGTTLGTNAILERKGARTGLLTTAGFRDVLELGRRTRPRPYGMTGQFEPLVPREWRLEVNERVDASGMPLQPLDHDGVAQAVDRLLRDGVESLAIVFLHSYANPAHEREAAAIALRKWPNGYVSTSHQVLPEVGEFERATATVINACLWPLFDRYFSRLQQMLRERGYGRSFRFVQSNGGTLSPDLAARHAVRSVLSGPAAGVVAGSWIARQAGYPRVISCDMGGTSFDVALIRDGEPVIAVEKEVEYGIPIRIPLVEMETIGAGGGSIAFVDGAGLLRVGPRSAGAQPGPICYGRGGREPTVTDADVLLGRLDIQTVPGVAHTTALRDTLQEAFGRLGAPLGLDAYQAAEAVLHVTDLNMAGAIRRVSIAKGADPRQFVLIAFGGAGPLHAASLAAELELQRVLIPPGPGVTSAIGCVLAEVRHDLVRTVHRLVSGVRPDEVRDAFLLLERQAFDLLRQDGIDPAGATVTRELEMQFDGQTHMLRVPAKLEKLDADGLRVQFRTAYRDAFGVDVEGIPVRLVNVRLTARAARPGVSADLRRLVVRAGDGEGVHHRLRADGAPRRPVWFAGTWHDAAVHWRPTLPVDAVLTGPACVEQSDSTTLIPPHWTAQIDGYGNLILERMRTSDGSTA